MAQRSGHDWPWLAAASVALASGIVVCAGIVAIGLMLRLYPHISRWSESRPLPDGFWWCLNHVWGNGCWLAP